MNRYLVYIRLVDVIKHEVYLTVPALGPSKLKVFKYEDFPEEVLEGIVYKKGNLYVETDLDNFENWKFVGD